jgi:hypothetical protein
MADPCINACDSVNFNGSGALPVLDCGYLQGMAVNASASGTLTLVDGTGKTLLNAMPLTAGQTPILFGGRYSKGLTATVGGTANVTLFFAG